MPVVQLHNHAEAATSEPSGVVYVLCVCGIHYSCCTNEDCAECSSNEAAANESMVHEAHCMDTHAVDPSQQDELGL